jgi:hypothetical protein
MFEIFFLQGRAEIRFARRPFPNRLACGDRFARDRNTLGSGPFAPFPEEFRTAPAGLPPAVKSAACLTYLPRKGDATASKLSRDACAI